MTTTVDIYARISLDRNGDQLSVDNQIKACREYAEQRGWIVKDVYSDNSISATKGKFRPDFEALLTRPNPRPVLMHNTDRLIRTMKDLERLLDTKVKIYSVLAGEMDLAGSQGRMVARLLTSVAQNEGELKAERMSLAFTAIAERGFPMWRKPPLGHTAQGKVFEKHAKYVREAVKAVLTQEKSCRSIAAQWNAAGVPTTRHAKAWTGGTVRECLNNPRIAGILVFKGQRMPHSEIEPIVSERDYEAISAFFANPDRKTGGARGISNLLSSIALCGRCNDGKQAVIATNAETDGGWGPIYRCPIGHNQHARGEVEWPVIAAVLNALEDDPSISDGEVDSEDRAEILRLRGQLAKWQQAAAADQLDPAEYLAITAPIKEALSDLETKNRDHSLAALFKTLTPVSELGPDFFANAHKVAEWWESIGLQRQRALVEHLFTVTLMPRHRFSPGAHADYVEIVRK